MSWVSINFGSLFGKRKAGTTMVSAEAAKVNIRLAKTDLQVEHILTTIEKGFKELHSCIDRSNADSKESNKELEARIMARLDEVIRRFDDRDNFLEGKIEKCRDEKHLRAVK